MYDEADIGSPYEVYNACLSNYRIYFLNIWINTDCVDKEHGESIKKTVNTVSTDDLRHVSMEITVFVGTCIS